MLWPVSACIRSHPRGTASPKSDRSHQPTPRFPPGGPKLQEKESIQEYLKVADKKISAAESALKAAKEEKVTKMQRLSEMEKAIQDAREARHETMA